MDENITLSTLAKLIDHSLLHPTVTDEAIIKGCEVAKKYGVATVCVKPYSIKTAAEILQGTSVGVCAVIGFPHGNSSISMKVKEAEEAVSDGAGEIDMVVNVGKVLGGDWEYVHKEIKAINDAVVGKKGLLKVIFENDYLEDQHIIKLCGICSKYNVAFVKTSTGYGYVKQANGMFSTTGATERHVRLMREYCPAHVGVKAAGGIRSLDGLLRMYHAGATRIGASATAEIIEEAKKRGFKN